MKIEMYSIMVEWRLRETLYKMSADIWGIHMCVFMYMYCDVANMSLCQISYIIT